MIDVKKITLSLFCLFIILVFLTGCQEDEISDAELEAELEQMSDEELKSILEEGKIEESKALAGKASAWRRPIKVRNEYIPKNRVVEKIRQSRIILDNDLKIKQTMTVFSPDERLKINFPKDLSIDSKRKIRFVPLPIISEKKQIVVSNIQNFILLNIDFSILSSVPMTFSEPVKMTYALDNEEIAIYSKKSSEDIRIALLNKEGELLQYVPFTFNLKSKNVDIWITHTYFDSFAILSLVGKNEWTSDIISSDGVYFSQESSNPVSVCIWDTPKKKCHNLGLGQPCFAKECGASLACDGKQPGDSCGVNMACNPNGECKHKKSFMSCSDNVKNQGETSVDCGGPCAPCNTKCTTGTKYGRADFGCTKDWPDNEDNKINFGNQVCDYKCNIFEVCSPEIDYVIQEASDCCAGNLNDKHSSSSENGCKWAIEEADLHFSGNNKACRAFYLIRYMTGLNIERKYMRYGFTGGMDCVKENSCGSEDEQSPLIKNLQCKGKPKYLISGNFEGSGWNSDTNMNENSCWIGPQPAHAMINVIDGGICIGNSISLVTLLRKAGFSDNNVGVVYKPGHATVLLRFPGDNKFHQIEPSKWDMAGYVYHSDISVNPGFTFPPGGSQGTVCTISRFMNDKIMENAPSKPIYNCDTVTSSEYGEDLFCGEELSYGVIMIQCGDNKCEGEESIVGENYCPEDCLVCGDNMCKVGIEDNPASYYYCSVDCP